MAKGHLAGGPSYLFRQQLGTWPSLGFHPLPLPRRFGHLAAVSIPPRGGYAEVQTRR